MCLCLSVYVKSREKQYAVRPHLGFVPALHLSLVFSLRGNFFFFPLCSSTFITRITQSCGEEEKWSGMRSVAKSSTFISLNYLVATEIRTSCLDCGNCWQLV